MKDYTFDILEADDGSGDAIIQFTEEFTAENDWRPGDRIHMEVEGEGLVLKNLDWIKRNESIRK